MSESVQVETTKTHKPLEYNSTILAEESLTFTNPLEDIEDYEEDEVVPSPVLDPDLEAKVRRACERISENVHICANEPSLAFYRLSEHVRKALPPTVESRQQVKSIQRQLGAGYQDADLALQEVKGMENASPVLNSTIEMLKNAISLQQQIRQEQSKRPVKKEPSMYQRLSAHLTSVELLSDLREISRISSSTSNTADHQSDQENPLHHRLPNPQ